MMYKILPLLFFFFSTTAFAGKITGIIKDDKGNVLPYASISVKEKNIGTTANQEGHYSLELSAGDYTIIVQYVGFAKQEKKVHIDRSMISILILRYSHRNCN